VTGLPPLAAAGSGGLLAAGLWLAATRPPPALPGRNFAALPATAAAARAWRRTARRLPAAGVTAAAVAVLTGWPVAALLSVPAVLALPGVLGPDRGHAAAVARVQAIASWAEMLRDTLAAAGGLEQAILATAPIAPPPLAPAVRALAEDLRRGRRLADALDALAADLADPTADLVVAALQLAAAGQATDLAELLGALAASARDHAAMQQRLAAARARTRTTVRIITATTLALAAVLAAADRSYLAAYNTATGQLVLLAVGALFATGLAWLARLARLDHPGRLLTPPHPRLATPGTAP
jgi:tight adherence protein B